MEKEHSKNTKPINEKKERVMLTKKQKEDNEINQVEKVNSRKSNRSNKEKNKSLLKTEKKNNENHENFLRIERKVQGRNVLILIDSGASKDFIDKKFNVEVLPLQKYNLILEKLTEVKENTKECQTSLVFKQQFNQEVKRTTELYAVLTVEDLEKKTKIKRVSEFLKELVDQYQDVFSDELLKELLPERNIDHEILLQEGTSPSYRLIYKMSMPEMKELKKQIEDYIGDKTVLNGGEYKGIIEP
ncbi:6936_t:CDS:2, partial [Cetraspora pellucida]